MKSDTSPLEFPFVVEDESQHSLSTVDDGCIHLRSSSTDQGVSKKTEEEEVKTCVWLDKGYFLKYQAMFQVPKRVQILRHNTWKRKGVPLKCSVILPLLEKLPKSYACPPHASRRGLACMMAVRKAFPKDASMQFVALVHNWGMAMAVGSGAWPRFFVFGCARPLLLPVDLFDELHAYLPSSLPTIPPRHVQHQNHLRERFGAACLEWSCNHATVLSRALLDEPAISHRMKVAIHLSSCEAWMWYGAFESSSPVEKDLLDDRAYTYLRAMLVGQEPLPIDAADGPEAMKIAEQLETRFLTSSPRLPVLL